MQVKTVNTAPASPAAKPGAWRIGVRTGHAVGTSGAAKNRSDFGSDIVAHPLDDAITGPLAGFVEGQGAVSVDGESGRPAAHPRGIFEGFVRATSKNEMARSARHRALDDFYTDYGRHLQLRFFDHFLHGKKNGWTSRRRCSRQVRHVDRFVERAETEWPLKRTKWTRFYLDPSDVALADKPAKKKSVIRVDAMGDGVTFLTPPLKLETEITGPSALRLFVSSSTSDADIFAVLRVFTGDLTEVVFQGAIDPHTPVGQGWLRASHRQARQETVTAISAVSHTHQEQALKPGEVVALDIEIWPTSIVVPAGYRVGLTIRGKDYVYPGPSGGKLSNFKNELTGCGPFLHDDPRDRPAEIFGGETSLHSVARRGPICCCLLFRQRKRKNNLKPRRLRHFTGRNGLANDGSKMPLRGAQRPAMHPGQTGPERRSECLANPRHARSAAARS